MSGRVREPVSRNGGRTFDPGFAAVLDNEACAALVIDAEAALLLAANKAGLALFALTGPVAFPIALDSAMPAVRRLRQIDAGSEPAHDEQLSLWCAGRLVRVAAKVSKELMSDGQLRLVVRALNADTNAASLRAGERAPAQVQAARVPPADAAPLPASSPTPNPDAAAAASAETAGPPQPRDDRDTLREIARRIREGHRPLDMSAVQDAANANTPQEPPAPTPPPSAVASEPAAKPSQAQAAAQAAPAATPGQSLPPRTPSTPPDARALSRIAHELKTPLSAIVAASEVMRDEQLGAMGNALYLGYARDIHESARHALDVINAMLTGTQREARHLAPVDLNEIAASTVSVMLPLARASSIHLEADCADERLEVTGDATAIRQIIYNLIANALKFTSRDGEVHLVTGYLPKGTPFFVVRDTGEGMSEDDIVRAFYGDDARIGARPGGGYGIGLPMVRHLAEMMGATIDVDSAPGKGTAVLVSFPRR